MQKTPPAPRDRFRRLRNSASAIVVAALILVGSAVPAQAEGPFTITGRIVDTAGNGVAGATVRTPNSCNCGDIASIPPATGVTASDGTFSVAVRDSASVSVVVDGPAPFVRSTLGSDGTLVAGGASEARALTASTSVGTLTLTKGVKISGTVSVTGFPLAGDGFVSLKAGANGYYSAVFPVIDGTQAWTTYAPAGSYAVSVYAPREDPAAYNGGANITVGASGADLGSVAIAGSGFAVRGTAMDPDGRPAAGVVADIYSVNPAPGQPTNSGGELSAADGTYTIVNVEPGAYRISFQNNFVSGAEYGFWPGMVTYEAAGLVDVSGSPRVVTVPAPDIVIKRGSPSEPRSVTAAAGDTKATVSWHAPANPGADSRTYLYTVTASPGGKTVTVDGSLTSVDVPDLTNGTAYTFRVTAANGFGTSPVSAASAAITPGAGSTATTPGAPTGVSGTSADGALTASWTAPASDGGSPITGYRVQVRAGDVVYGSAQVDATARQSSISGLPNGKALSVIVWAQNAVGESAAATSAATVTPAGKPLAATAVSAKAGDGAATVTWKPGQANGSAITGYSVTAIPGGRSVSVGANAQTATVTGLQNGTSYTFTVTAKNAVGSTVSAVSAAVKPRQAFPAGLGDLNADGAADVIARTSAGQLLLYPGNGAGGWKPRSTAVAGWGTRPLVTLGDFTGDGIGDVARVEANGALTLFAGNGKGGFAAGKKIGAGWAGFTALIGGVDFDGDGFTDVLARTSAGDLLLYRGNGAGGWATGTGTKVGSGWGGFTSIFYAGDFDGDKKGDILARSADGKLWLYPTKGNGTWGTKKQVGSGWGAFTAVFSPGDFDGNGTSDVLARGADGRLHLYPGNGTGGWGTPRVVGSGWQGFTQVG